MGCCFSKTRDIGSERRKMADKGETAPYTQSQQSMHQTPYYSKANAMIRHHDNVHPSSLNNASNPSNSGSYSPHQQAMVHGGTHNSERMQADRGGWHPRDQYDTQLNRRSIYDNDNSGHNTTTTTHVEKMIVDSHYPQQNPNQISTVSGIVQPYQQGAGDFVHQSYHAQYNQHNETNSSQELAAQPRLKHRLNKKNEEIKELEEKLHETNAKLKDMSSCVYKKDKEIEFLKTELNTARINLNDMSKSLCKKDEDIENLKAQLNRSRINLNDMSTRLAMEMGKKVAADESSIENVSIKDRPMNISEDYEILATEAWLNAKNVLDEFTDRTEEHKLRFLCEVLMVAEQAADSAFKTMMEETRQQLSDLPVFMSVGSPLAGPSVNPGEHQGRGRQEAWTDDAEDTSGCVQTNRKRKKATEEKKNVKERKVMSARSPEKTTRERGAVNRTSFTIPLIFTNAIRDYLRGNSNNVDKQRLVQHVSNMLAKHEDGEIREVWKKTQNDQDITHYITSSVTIAWKMVIQSPRMTFRADNIGERYTSDKYSVAAWNSKNPYDPNSRIICYAYPELYQDKVLMAKGKVYVKPPDVKRKSKKKGKKKGNRTPDRPDEFFTDDE